MNTILDVLRKEIVDNGGDATNIHIISEALRVLFPSSDDDSSNVVGKAIVGQARVGGE